MSNIKQIEKALLMNERERMRLKDELEELKQVKTVPALKKKWEGKYFKYENGYSADVRWPLYSYCKQVLNEHTAIVCRFEKIPTEGWSFSVGSEEGTHLFQQEITRGEFDKAAKQMLEEAESIAIYE